MGELEKAARALPHDYPFVFVDKVLTLEAGKRGTGLKNVSANEYYFRGHFRGRPIVPGVLIIEALAQMTGIVLMGHRPAKEDKELSYLARVRDIKFKRPVRPGDQLILYSEITGRTGDLVRAHVKAEARGETVAEGNLVLAMNRNE